MSSSLSSTPATHQTQALLLSNSLCPVLLQACLLTPQPLCSPESPPSSPSPTGPGRSFIPGAESAPSLLSALPGSCHPRTSPSLSAWFEALHGQVPADLLASAPTNLFPATCLQPHLLCSGPPAFPPAVPQPRRVTQPQTVSLWDLPPNNGIFVLSWGPWWAGQ